MYNSNIDGEDTKSAEAIEAAEAASEDEYGSVGVPAGAVDLQYIRGRGNSTRETYGRTKKPYKIKYKKKQELFGVVKTARP